MLPGTVGPDDGNGEAMADAEINGRKNRRTEVFKLTGCAEKIGSRLICHNSCACEAKNFGNHGRVRNLRGVGGLIYALPEAVFD